MLFKGIDLAIGLRIGARQQQRLLDAFHRGGSTDPELTAALRVQEPAPPTAGSAVLP